MEISNKWFLIWCSTVVVFVSSFSFLLLEYRLLVQEIVKLNNVVNHENQNSYTTHDQRSNQLEFYSDYDEFGRKIP